LRANESKITRTKRKMKTKRRSQARKRYYQALKRRTFRDLFLTGVTGRKEIIKTIGTTTYRRLQIVGYAKCIEVLNNV